MAEAEGEPPPMKPRTTRPRRSSLESRAARARCATISRRSPSNAPAATCTGARRGRAHRAHRIADRGRRVSCAATSRRGADAGVHVGDARRRRRFRVSARAPRPRTDEADELLVPSPFDYSRQAMLYVPRDLPDADATTFDRRRRRAHARAARADRRAARSCCSRRIARCATPPRGSRTALSAARARRGSARGARRSISRDARRGVARHQLVLGGRRRPRRCAQPRRDRQAAVRAAHRSARRRAHEGAAPSAARDPFAHDPAAPPPRSRSSRASAG